VSPSARPSRARAAAQRLHQPPGGAVDVVRHLLAVQAQDLRAARLALRARAEGLTASAIDTALEQRALVIAWLNRGTLHLVAPDDHAWLLALTAPRQTAGNRRRLGQEGVSDDDADRAVAIIEAALADAGPLTRAELGDRIAARGIRAEGQALPHLLFRAALRGLIVVVGERRYALTRDWLGAPPPPVDRDAALADLGRRYLAAHAPAEPGDLAAWAGLSLRDARAALERAGPPAAPRDGEPIPPRLLGAYDPYLLGWKDRSFAVPAEHARLVHPGGGVVRAVATVDGRVVGSWEDVADEPAFAGELADVERFRAH
jgi:winged helix DNA-binding protein